MNRQDLFAKNNDGVTYISQSRLISLQKDARVLVQKSGRGRAQQNGHYLSSFKGRGMEFDEARPYQPGDDIRNMDWRVTARTNKPHAKVYREERERPVLLWVDFRLPMFFGTQTCFKSVLASQVAAILAWQAISQGDRLGGLIFSEQKHLELRPARGKSATLHMIKQLSDFSLSRLGDQQTADIDRMTTVSMHALNRLVHVTRPGSQIFLISDFRHPSNRLEAVVNRLGKHNELQFIHLSDPLEHNLPGGGIYRVTDGSREESFNASDRQTRDNYQTRFIRHQDYLQTLSQKNRGRFISISTNQPLLNSLLETPATNMRAQ